MIVFGVAVYVLCKFGLFLIMACEGMYVVFNIGSVGLLIGESGEMIWVDAGSFGSSDSFFWDKNCCFCYINVFFIRLKVFMSTDLRIWLFFDWF